MQSEPILVFSELLRPSDPVTSEVTGHNQTREIPARVGVRSDAEPGKGVKNSKSVQEP
jgi:hypothetical protein